MSAIKSNGIRTAINENVSEMMVKPMSAEPLRAACIGVSPFSMYREIFSIITIASSTTKPVAIVNAIKVRLLMEKSQR